MNEKDSRLIEAYLEGALQGEELKAFEARLQIEEELNTELELLQEVNRRLKTHHKENLTAEWRTFLTENVPLQQSGRRFRLSFKVVGVAASILLLIAVFWWFRQPPSPAVLADNYWEELDSFWETGFVRTSGQVEEQQLQLAYIKFKEEDYSGALTILSEQPEPTNNGLLLLGACYYLQRNYTGAAEAFQRILNDPKYIDQDEASWYLTLTKLQQGEIESAKELLTGIIENGQWEAELARELLKKLN